MKECSLGKDKELKPQRELEFKKENPVKYIKCRNVLYLLKPWYRSEKIPGVTFNG